MREQPRPPSASEASERLGLLRTVLDEHASMSLATVVDGEPWLTKLFFVDDEPTPGCLDLCSAMILTPRRSASLRADPRVAFMVAGDEPDRWVQGTGRVEVVEDEAEARAIVKRLADKSAAAGPFLDRIAWTAVRIHVDRATLTDVGTSPPIAEFSFA